MEAKWTATDFIDGSKRSTVDDALVIKSFKQEFTFDEWLQKSAAMIANYPDRIPVNVERFSRSNLPQMEKGIHFHNTLQAPPIFRNSSLCLVNNTLPQTASLMGSDYDLYKDKDDFLYMCYISEKAFG